MDLDSPMTITPEAMREIIAQLDFLASDHRYVVKWATERHGEGASDESGFVVLPNNPTIGTYKRRAECLETAAAMLRSIAAEMGWRDMDSAPKIGPPILLKTTTRVGDHQIYFDTGGEHFDAVQIGYWDDGFESTLSPWANRPAQWITEKIGTPIGWLPLPKGAA